MQKGAEDLTQIILDAEGQKEVAAQAAADATSSATKAREVLTDMLVSIGSEVSNARQESMQLKVGGPFFVFFHPFSVVAFYHLMQILEHRIKTLKGTGDCLKFGSGGHYPRTT